MMKDKNQLKVVSSNSPRNRNSNNRKVNEFDEKAFKIIDEYHYPKS